MEDVEMKLVSLAMLTDQYLALIRRALVVSYQPLADEIDRVEKQLRAEVAAALAPTPFAPLVRSNEVQL